MDWYSRLKKRVRTRREDRVDQTSYTRALRLFGLVVAERRQLPLASLPLQEPLPQRG